MLRRFFALIVTAFSATTASAGIITFEDLTLPTNSFQNGSTLTPGGFFTSGGAVFNNTYVADPDYPYWSGWAYSNVKDVATAGFGNQYAAYNLPGVGSGDNSANYAVAYAFSPGDATITLAPGERPVSIRVTNTTYTALSIRDGDQFAKKFGGESGNDPDFLLLSITGLNAQNQSTGSVDFYLADYRHANNANDYFISAWTTVDLSTLGESTQKLSFGLTSSDVNAFGIKTPTYFAVDNLATVPEPGVLVLLLPAVAGFVIRRRSTLRAVNTLV